MAFLSCPEQDETFSKPRARSVYWIPSLALVFQHLCPPHGSTVGWSLLIPGGCLCLLLSGIPFLSLCSSFPLLSFSGWTGVQAASLASLLHPHVIIHSDFKCAPTIISLHQKPCISSFLKCQAFFLFDVNDYWTYIKKIPPPIIFPVCLFQRVTCGSSAW